MAHSGGAPTARRSGLAEPPADVGSWDQGKDVHDVACALPVYDKPIQNLTLYQQFLLMLAG